jgi:hypothetical protein
MSLKGVARGERLTDPVIWPLAAGDDQYLPSRSGNRDCAADNARGGPALGGHERVRVGIEELGDEGRVGGPRSHGEEESEMKSVGASGCSGWARRGVGASGDKSRAESWLETECSMSRSQQNYVVLIPAKKRHARSSAQPRSPPSGSIYSHAGLRYSVCLHLSYPCVSAS